MGLGSFCRRKEVEVRLPPRHCQGPPESRPPEAPHPLKARGTTEGVGRGPAPWVGQEARVAGGPGGKSPEPRRPPPLGRLPTAMREVWQGRGPPSTRCPQQSGLRQSMVQAQWRWDLGPERAGLAGGGGQKTLLPPRGVLASGRGSNTEGAESLPGPGGQTHLLLLRPVSRSSPPLSVSVQGVSPTRKRGWAGGGALRPPGTASSPLLRQWRL